MKFSVNFTTLQFRVNTSNQKYQIKNALPCLQAVVVSHSDLPLQTSPEDWADSTVETVDSVAAPLLLVLQEASPLPAQRDGLLHSTFGP